MSAGTIFCEYIYGTFLLVSAALEVGMALAKTTLDMLSTMFDAIMTLFKYTIDVAVSTIIDGVRVLQKKLVDLLWDGYKEELDENGKPTGKKKSKFCNNLFKCNIFIEELTDRNSLICTTLRSLGVLNDEKQQFISSIISDYDQFMNTICTFGFTFNFGLSALKKMLNAYKATVKGFINTIERKKESIRRLIQKYLNMLQDSGIFDMLAKIRKFFNCILEQTGACQSISTAHHFYSDALEKMCIEESGTGGYKLEAGLNNKMMNAFDGRLNEINNVQQELDKFADSLVSPSDVKASLGAFNISKNIFPGGMSWTDIKKGRWRKNAMLRYFATKADEFMDAFIREKKTLPPDISTEYVLNGMTINDKEGIIKVEVNGLTEVIDMNDPATKRIYGKAIVEKKLSQPFEFYETGDSEPGIFDAFYYNGEIISAMRAAVMIAQGDENMKRHVDEKVAGLTGMMKENELAVHW